MDGSKGMDMTEDFLAVALGEAKLGSQEGGLPIGAALILEGEVIGRGRNRRVQHSSSILHAITDCLEQAGRRSASVYSRSVLYTTLSPCDMCAGAILLYGIPKIVIGDNRHFRGPEQYLEVRGVNIEVRHDQRCRRLLDQYVRQNPALWREYIGLK
jgi:creatinine deaminase